MSEPSKAAQTWELVECDCPVTYGNHDSQCRVNTISDDVRETSIWIIQCALDAHAERVRSEVVAELAMTVCDRCKTDKAQRGETLWYHLDEKSRLKRCKFEDGWEHEHRRKAGEGGE